MFSKILIANRGEIACRVIKTAKRMGIKTVAIHSEADNNSTHVMLADESINIGGLTSQESYLDINKIVDAVKKTNSDAVHLVMVFYLKIEILQKKLKILEKYL